MGSVSCSVLVSFSPALPFDERCNLMFSLFLNPINMRDVIQNLLNLRNIQFEAKI